MHDTLFITAFICAIAMLAIATPAVAIDNGIGRTPPMGWRSWNAFHGSISQAIMTAQADAMAATAGRPGQRSLLSYGFEHVGLDDNWQQCGKGINGSFHNAQGQPLINHKTFPDMAAFNQHAHGLGLKTGWYFNNCICNEAHSLQPDWPPQMHGDTHAIASLGWDGVKIDGCGPSHNLTEWAALLNATGRPIMIENCHDSTNGDGSKPGPPGFPRWENGVAGGTLECPMNFWRVSQDIQSHWGSIIHNINMTRAFQDEAHPIAQPGCWAYPDMLEPVEILQNTFSDRTRCIAQLRPGSSFLRSAPRFLDRVGRLANATEDRSHFGLWSVVSAPLILGFDLTDAHILTRVWDIITNEEAIAVNQAWHGHPGRLVAEKLTATAPPMPRFNDSTPVSMRGDGRHHGTAPPASWQVWAKDMGPGKQAVLLVNADRFAQDVSVSTAALGFGAGTAVTVRDIWARADGKGIPAGGAYTAKQLGAHDSVFLLLTAEE